MGGACIVMLAVLAQAPGGQDRNVLPVVSDRRDGAHGSIDLRSDMGKRFRLTEAVLVLDGAEVARRTAAPGKELEHTLRLWSSGQTPVNAERVAGDGPLHAGHHALTVRLTYEGRNVGPFSYLDDYKMRAESTFAFEVDNADRGAALQVVARERANPKAPLRAEPLLTIEPGSSADPIAPPSKEPAP
jgi:hypothetical protein